MKKISKNLTIVLVSLMALLGRNAYAYRDSISPDELYGDNNMTSDAAGLALILMIVINGGFFLMMWFKKKKNEKINLQNLKKLTDNPNTPDSLRKLRTIQDLFTNMKTLHCFHMRSHAENKEKEINEKGECIGFILESSKMWDSAPGYTVLELKK